MSKVLVLGAYGLLGCSLCPHLTKAGHSVMRQGRADGAEFRNSLADSKAVNDLIVQAHPEIVINLTAMTNVDQCEREPDSAFRANTLLPEWTAQALKGTSARMVQISTDQIYDGDGPHSETAPVIRNTYALSKYAGELAALSCEATVLRTNFFGKSRCERRASFSDWIFQSLRAGIPLTVFDDVLFSPLSIASLCQRIERVVNSPRGGVYNLGSADGLSKADFALQLASGLGLPGSLLTRGLARDVAFVARRPTDMRMSSDLFERTFSIATPTLSEEISTACKDYGHDQD